MLPLHQVLPPLLRAIGARDIAAVRLPPAALAAVLRDGDIRTVRVIDAPPGTCVDAATDEGADRVIPHVGGAADVLPHLRGIHVIVLGPAEPSQIARELRIIAASAERMGGYPLVMAPGYEDAEIRSVLADAEKTRNGETASALLPELGLWFYGHRVSVAVMRSFRAAFDPFLEAAEGTTMPDGEDERAILAVRAHALRQENRVLRRDLQRAQDRILALTRWRERWPSFAVSLLRTFLKRLRSSERAQPQHGESAPPRSLPAARASGVPATPSAASSRRVTVVIPVHRDVHATLECLASCREHIDRRHAILVVNDASPEPDMAPAVRQAVAAMPNARYEENPRNIGFVETCNRAVLELDASGNDVLLLNADTVVTGGFLEEMQACLDLSDRHAVACPRSDHATICTLPQIYDGPREHFSRRSVRCWERMRNVLRRCTPIPTAVGFCMLIRRSVIDRFGLFDPVYGPGYNEENDFCRRINRYGYSSILCNRAYVFHRGERSFGEERRARLEADHAAILHARYPEYPRTIAEYLRWGMDAAEHFADVLGECHDRRRLLIDCSGLFRKYAGTTEYALAVTERLVRNMRDSCDVRIMASPKTCAFFGLGRMGVAVMDPDAMSGFHADLLFVPHQLFDPQQLFRMNALAARICFTLQDVIAIRCDVLRNPHMMTAWRTALDEADGVLCISDSARTDAEQYFGAADVDGRQRRVVIRHGVDPAENGVEPHAEGPVLVVGNAYEHKALARALACIPRDVPVVVLGGTPSMISGWQAPARVIESGREPPEDIRRLYASSRALVYPSQYEGCGLPVLHAAAAGTPVIAADTAVNRELREAYGLHGHMRLFHRFGELPSVLRSTLDAPRPERARIRSWDACARETERVLSDLLDTPVDIRRLERRFRRIRDLERMSETPPPSSVPAVRGAARALARSLIIRAGLGPAARRVQAALRGASSAH